MFNFSTYVWYFKSSILSMDRRPNLLTKFQRFITESIFFCTNCINSSLIQKVVYLHYLFYKKLYRSSYSHLPAQIRFWPLVDSFWPITGHYRKPKASLKGKSSTLTTLSFALLVSISFKFVFGRFII